MLFMIEIEGHLSAIAYFWNDIRMLESRVRQ